MLRKVIISYLVSSNCFFWPFVTCPTLFFVDYLLIYKEIRGISTVPAVKFGKWKGRGKG